MHDEQAKAETIDKVISIVRKQLALPADTKVSPESTFTKDLGADSLDTVSSVGFRIFIKTIQHLSLLYVHSNIIILTLYIQYENEPYKCL